MELLFLKERRNFRGRNNFKTSARDFLTDSGRCAHVNIEWRRRPIYYNNNNMMEDSRAGCACELKNTTSGGHGVWWTNVTQRIVPTTIGEPAKRNFVCERKVVASRPMCAACCRCCRAIYYCVCVLSVRVLCACLPTTTTTPIHHHHIYVCVWFPPTAKACLMELKAHRAPQVWIRLKLKLPLPRIALCEYIYTYARECHASVNLL